MQKLTEPPVFLMRPARLDDVAAIQALLRETWHAAYDGIFGADGVETKCDIYFSDHVIRHYVDQSPRDYFAVLEEETGGLAAVSLIRMSPFGCACVNVLYVRPAFQRLGLGTAFLDAIPVVFPWARAVALEVLEPNAPAIAFYEARGFKRRGRGGRHKDMQVPIVLMWRQLASQDTWWSAFTAFLRQGWDDRMFRVRGRKAAAVNYDPSSHLPGSDAVAGCG